MVCRKDRLRVYKIEKTDFLKLCLNKGLGKTSSKNISFVLFRDLFIFGGIFFNFARGDRLK